MDYPSENPHSTKGRSRSGEALVSRSGALLAVCLVLTSLGAVVAAGGWLHLLWAEADEAVTGDGAARQTAAILGGVAAFFAVGSAIGCRRRRSERKGILFVAVLCGLICAAHLLAIETAGRMTLPDWPARDLRGVDPEMSRQWIGDKGANASRRWNRWGQPDAEHAIRAKSGTFRIAMIGDSFLDESAGDAVTAVTQARLNRSDVEILNLGISATAPDEYFYRLKNVALKLDIDACLVFLYTGNDLSAPWRTLVSYGGIAAVTPRGSLFTDLGLHGLNSLLTNRRRPVLAAWSNAGGLARAEQELHSQFQDGDDAAAAELLSRQTPVHYLQYGPLLQHLQRPEMSSFYAILRHPDEGRFRSYFLPDAVWSAATGRIPPDDDLNIAATVHWTMQMAHLCDRAQIPLLVAVIPEGFQVDPRLEEQWRPLADMRSLTAARRQAALSVISELRTRRVSVLDLADALDGVRGTYLNLDGHWSKEGTAVVAETIAGHLTDTVLTGPPAASSVPSAASTMQMR